MKTPRPDPDCSDHDVGGEGKQQPAADLARGALDAFGERSPLAQFDVETPQEHDRRREFNDAIKTKSRVKLPALIPAKIATAPSTIIHAIVSHSSLDARSISALRSGYNGFDWFRGAPATVAAIIHTVACRSLRCFPRDDVRTLRDRPTLR